MDPCQQEARIKEIEKILNLVVFRLDSLIKVLNRLVWIAIPSFIAGYGYLFMQYIEK